MSDAGQVINLCRLKIHIMDFDMEFDRFDNDFRFSAQPARRFGDEIEELVMSVRLMTLSERMIEENKDKTTEELGAEILNRMIESAKKNNDEKAVADFQNAIARLSRD